MATEVWLTHEFPRVVVRHGATRPPGGHRPAAGARASRPAPGHLDARAGLVMLAAGLMVVGLLAAQLRRPRLALSRRRIARLARARVSRCMCPSSRSSASCSDSSESAARQETRKNRNGLAGHPHGRSCHRLAPAGSQATARAWCSGYITIRGTWCEPLNVPLVNRLNQRLADVTRARRPPANQVSPPLQPP